MNSVLFLLVCLIVLLAIKVPLMFSLGLSSLFYLLVFHPELVPVIPQRIWSGTNSFLMIALPLFVLAGELMNSGGLTKKLLRFSKLLVRPIGGGLGEVNVVASIVFGGISGSSVADTSALGSILIPSMVEDGYPLDFSCGVTVASSTIGMVVPPSIPMVVYSMISGVSIGALFLGGLIPGLAVGLTQLVLVNIISRKKHYLKEGEHLSAKEWGKIALDGIPAMLMPLIIICSISFGIATATESAAIAVLYSLVLGFLYYHELSWDRVKECLKTTFITSSSIMIVIGVCTIFAWIVTLEQVPLHIVAFLNRINLARWQFLIILDLIILLFGFFMDVSSIILLLSPILLPVAQSFSVSPMQFGIIMIVGTAIGLVTPPVGMCLNVASKISKLTINQIFKGALPFICCNLLVLFGVTALPAMSEWLPALGM